MNPKPVLSAAEAKRRDLGPFPVLPCAEELPECENDAAVAKRWGLDAGEYSQRECCKNHRVVKSMLTALIRFFERENIKGWFVEGGSLLGLVRHEGTMIPWDNDADIHILINSSYPHALNRDNYIDRLMRFNTEYTSPFSLEKCYQPKPPHGICTTAFKLHPGHLIGSNDLWKVRRERDVYLLNATRMLREWGVVPKLKPRPSLSRPRLSQPPPSFAYAFVSTQRPRMSLAR